MKHRNLKTLLVLSLALAMLLSTVAFAEETLTPGVTVAADASSPTGYYVTFTYEDEKAQEVLLNGTFAFYRQGTPVGVIPAEYIPVSDWEPGLFRASSTDLAATVPMTKAEGTNLWSVTLALPSGHYIYKYMVDGENISDPINVPMKSTAESGSEFTLCTVDVPYDPCQGASINFDFMLARTDEQVGQLLYADYTDANGDMAPLAIYLPYGYDAERADAYPTLYLSHGGGGSEMEWFASGNTHHVFDNLIADGAVEPTVIVTMNNTNYEWDYEIIIDNLMNNIIPYIEENYNVGTEAADRAFAGLSMGGMTTTHVYAAEPDQFGYICIMSGSDASIDFANMDLEKLRMPTLMLGSGYLDGSNNVPVMKTMALTSVNVALGMLDIPFDFYIVDGGHDWTVWPQLIDIFATNYLWK